jgi:hypothetical protein
VVVAWQLAYVVIGWNPIRLCPMMPLAALAKAGFVGTIVVLLALGRTHPSWLGVAAFDGTFAVLFLIAYARTPSEPSPWDRNPKRTLEKK